MPSTYTVNLGIEKPATGEQSGTWGDTTNVNFDILDQAINGAERVTLTSAGSSGSPNTLQITNGATSDGRNKWLEFYSSSDLGGSAFVQLDPNDAEKIVFVRNSLAGSQSVILFQGTYNAARDLEVPAGVDMVVKFDGGGASAATVTDVFTKLRATEITTPTLTAGTADINGGTVDGAVIGGSSAAAITGTTVTANTSLNIAGDGATVTGIKDEDDMSSNSPTKLATQQSIKAYVDSQVGTVDTWAEVLANGATSGSTNPEVTAGQALKTNTINETTAGSGVTIDSVLLKDDVVNATDIETGSISANDGTAAATIANSTGNFTITNLISNSVDIGGGAIDGTNIGASSAGTGAFTTLDASAAFTGTTATFTTDNNTAQLTLVSTDADAGVGPVFDLTRNSASPAADDGLAQIRFNGQDSAGSELSYAHLRAFIVDPTDGSEDGKFEIDVRTAGGQRSRLLFDSTETVFNQESRDFDFRVESDGNANMLFVDGGNDAVGIGTNSITGLMELNKTSSGNTLQLLSLVNPVGATSTGAQLWMSGTNATTRGTTIEAVAQSTANNHDLIFSTSAASSAPAEALRIDSGQQVGIGTGADVDQMLHVERSSGTTMVKTEVAAGSVVGFEIQKTGSTTSNWRLVDGQVANGQIVLYDVTNSRSILNADASEVVINDTSANLDFRVESDSNTHMLFVDAGGDKIIIGASSSNSDDEKLVVVADSDTDELDNGFSVYRSVGDDKVTINAQGGSANFVSDGGSGYAPMRFVMYDGTTPVDVAKWYQNVVVFNEASGDIDFRVESDSNTHALFVDAGNNHVNINTSADSGGTLNVAGDIFNDLGSDKYFRRAKYIDPRNVCDGVFAGYLLLVPYNSGSAATGAAMEGTFVASRGNSGTGNGPSRCQVWCSAVYTNTLAWFKKEGADQFFQRLVRVTYNGTEYMALEFAQTNGGPVNGIYFDGWSIRADSNFLFMARDTEITGSVLAFDTPHPYHYIETTNNQRFNYGATFNEAGGDHDFRVESDSNSHMLFVDAGNSRVGIGDSAPDVALSVVTGGSNEQFHVQSPTPGMKFIDSSLTTRYFTIGGENGHVAIHADPGSAQSDSRILLKADGSTIARFDGDGLKFGSDTAAANALDDYEEGTWTPTIFNGTVTYTAQRGRYTKIGRVVYIHCFIQIASISGANSTNIVAGLPFTSKNDGNYPALASKTNGFDYGGSSTMCTFQVVPNTTHIAGVGSGNNQSFRDLNSSGLSANDWIAFSGHYVTDS